MSYSTDIPDERIKRAHEDLSAEARVEAQVKGDKGYLILSISGFLRGIYEDKRQNDGTREIAKTLLNRIDRVGL